MEEPRIPKTKEGKAVPHRDQEHAHRVFWRLRDCAPWICPRRPDRECRVLLQCSSLSEGGHSAKTIWTVVHVQLAAPWWQCTLSPSSRNAWISHPQQRYHTSASTLLTGFGPLQLLPLQLRVAALTEWRRSSRNHRMFLVHFKNRTSSTRSSSGNGAGIDVSLPNGTILKGMLPKLKSSKYILVCRSSLGTFWYTLLLYVPVCLHICILYDIQTEISLQIIPKLDKVITYIISICI